MGSLDSQVIAGRYLRAVDYRVLGPVEVLAADGVATALGGPKQRTVVAVLVASAGRGVAVDVLLQALYGEDASPSSRASLHTYVSNLRHVLGDVIVRQGDTYRLDCAAATIDAGAFEDSFRAAVATEDADAAASRLREALSMWRGHPYADVEAHGFLDGEVTRLSELRLSALEARIEADMNAGRHSEVIAELDALTVEHPFRESLRGLHMLALYRSGRQAEALRAFVRTRESLVEGLGIDPSPDLQELERRILAQDRDLLIAVGPTVQRRAVLVADIDDAGWHGPAEREIAFAHRESELDEAADREAGVKLAPKGTAGYVVFADPIHAVRAARAVVNERTRVAVDFGDLEIRDDEPIGPPLARAARLVAVAHPGQVLVSSAAHDALTASAEAGWAAESLGRFDIVGLDPGVHIYQLVGQGFSSDFPALRIDRLPPPVPGGADRSVPGYELRALIGVGQLGEVHRAYQPSVGREVAVRIFGPSVVGHPQFVRRFETASQRITRVEHPHIVPLVDYWREPDRAVMVSRLLGGGHLGERIPGDGFDAASALALFETVASGVASAHRHGVVHGRIRPENVLFDGDGNAYVADLGVDEVCAGVITFATSAYDAPERLGGVLATPAADVYSLGILMHHLLGGSSPPPDGPLPLGEGRISAVVGRATDPDPACRHGSVDELMGELRDALAAPADPTAVFVPTRNPYRGLEPFEQADAEDFYGRDRAVAEMIEVLVQERLLIVVGPSGIGKSSVVKAGLVPALGAGAVAGSESWLVTEMVPARAPFDQLAAALERVASVALPDVVGQLTNSPDRLDGVVGRLIPPDVGLLVVVDQLEELFTQTIDDSERRAFLHMMAGLANLPDSAVRLVATLRADFFDRPLGYPGFGEAIRNRTVVLGAMVASELADAVRRPAAGVGVEIEAALVERVVAAAELQPGGLPLVQHTMAELFEGRDTNTITLDSFDELGGLAGAIGRRAEAIYSSFDEHTRVGTHRIFLRLVSVREGHEDTRRRVRRTELEQAGITADDLDTVLGEYGRHRLLTFDRDPVSRTPTVELAHEALLTEWERYRGWVDDARQDLLTRRRLESAAHEWVNAGSDASFLYRDGRLELAESWAAASDFELTEDERRFLATSRQKVDRDRVARTRRRRAIIGVLAGALVAATVMAVVAVVQRRNAEGAGTLAEARRLGTQALVVDGYDQALLLAVEGRHLDDSRETRANLLETIERSPGAVGVIRDPSFGFVDVAVTPDGTSLLASSAGDPDGVIVFDVATGQRRTSAPTPTHPVHVALSADGRLAVHTDTTGANNTPEFRYLLRQFDPTTLESLGPPLAGLGPDVAPTRLSISPDNRLVGAVTDIELEGRTAPPPEALVWDTAQGGEPVLRFAFDGTSGRDMVLMPDSKTMLVAGHDGTTVVDIATGRAVRRIEGAYAPIALSPDATTLAATVNPATAVTIGLFDTATGEQRATLAGHSERIARLVFSPGGTALASGGDDRLVMVWGVPTGERRAVFSGHAAAVKGLAFTPDGTTLYSSSLDRSIYEWDLLRAGTLVHQVPRGVPSTAPDLPVRGEGVSLRPDGAEVVYQSGEDWRVQFRDVATGELSPPIAATARQGSPIVFTPDSRRYLARYESGALKLWDRATGSLLAESSTENPGIGGSVTPDGRHFVIADINEDDLSSHLEILDATTLEPVRGAPLALGPTALFVAVTPDSRHALVVLHRLDQPSPIQVLVVDLDEWRIVRSTTIDATGRGAALHDTLAGDGRTLGLGSTSGHVQIVDAMTGEISPPFQAHDGFVDNISFAPDLGTFVTSGTDGAIKLWETKTQQLLGAVEPLGANQPVVAWFTGPGEVLMAYASGELFEWDTRSDAWEAHACAVAGRNLTTAEWAELLPDRAYRSACPQYPAGE